MANKKNMDLLSVAQVAKLKGLTLSTVYYYLHTGRGPVAEDIDGREFFRREDVLSWEPKPGKRGRKANAGA